MPDSLCSYGWHELFGIIMSVWIGFQYISNSKFVSLRCISRTRKLIDSCSSFSIVNLMVGCNLLKSLCGQYLFYFDRILSICHLRI
jgi:hypothetical protein